MSMESSQFNTDKLNGAEKRRKAAKEEAEQILKRHEEMTTPGLAEPEISPEFVSQTKEHLEDIKGQLEARMADLEGTRNKSVIKKLKDEIKELETFVLKHNKKETGRKQTSPTEESVDIDVSEFAEKKTDEVKIKERKPTIRAINLQIENQNQKLGEAVSRRLDAIRSADSSALKAVQKEILQTRDELAKLRAERETLREANKTFVKEKMREALAHYESSKKERARHTKLSEAGVTLEELKERELDKKDTERWSKLLKLDAEQNRLAEDYKLLRSNYEALEPEAISGFIENIKKEAKTGDLNMQHAASQLISDIEAGRVAGFTEVEAKFFTASEEEAHARSEALETMPPEMAAEEAISEWEKIKKRSAKGETESQVEEEAFIDYLKNEYPDTVTFTGKQYIAARMKPKKAGFFKKLFSFSKVKSDFEEMEEALNQVPNSGKLAGSFLEKRMDKTRGVKPMSVKGR